MSFIENAGKDEVRRAPNDGDDYDDDSEEVDADADDAGGRGKEQPLRAGPAHCMPCDATAMNALR
jgi:hypothetical protein